MTRKPHGVREALQRRQVRTTHYDLPLVAFEDAQAKAQDLAIAEQTITAAEFLIAQEPHRPDVDDALKVARATRDAARKARDACFHRITFAGLPEDDFDAMVQLHPPTADQIRAAQAKGEDPPLWDSDTLIPDLLEHCSQDSELTAAEWAVELKGWTRGERQDIAAKVLEANIRSFATALSFV